MKPKKNFKKIVILIIFILTGLFLGIIYFWKIYPSISTKRWKEINDSVSHASFKYPSDWIINSKVYNHSDNPDGNTEVFFNLKSPEYIKEETKNEGKDLMEISPIDKTVHSFFTISCYKNVDSLDRIVALDANGNVIKFKTLKDWIGIDPDGVKYKKDKFNSFDSYSGVTTEGIKKIYIQSDKGAICGFYFYDQELTDTEKQFLNSFKFN